MRRALVLAFVCGLAGIACAAIAGLEEPSELGIVRAPGRDARADTSRGQAEEDEVALHGQ